MISEDGEWVLCEEQPCEEKLKNHAWAQIKSEGWFFTRDGKAYCPRHIPAWVTEWRKKKGKA